MTHYSAGAQLATDLVNTFDVFAEEELLGSVADLAEFAAEHELDARLATKKDLERLRRARPVLRSALLSDDQRAAVAALNDLLAAARPQPRLVPGTDESWKFRYADHTATLADQILAEASAEALEEIRDHGMRRLNTCSSSTCEDLFVDQSRNRSRRYCTPDVCGNREAQRAYRARQAGRTEASIADEQRTSAV